MRPTRITVGAGSLGWVDLIRGIILLRNLFDEYPVIQYIPLPEPKVCITDEDGDTFYGANFPEYIRDVTCCNDLIKLVDVEFYDGGGGSDHGWIATTWDRMISWDDWRERFTVDIADISVDPSYCALLPELWDDKTKELELKKLSFYAPTLSMHDDDFVYMMAKVNDEDEKALDALAPFSTEGHHLIAVYCPCAFPKYLNMTPGADMADPVDKYFKRMRLAHCVLEVLFAQDWFRELDKCLEFERSSYNECRSLLHCCAVSSLRFNIRPVVEYASSNGQGKAASEAVDVCLRALEDLDMLLSESLSDPSASVEAMRSKISVALRALDNLLQTVPQAVIAIGTALVDAYGDWKVSYEEQAVVPDPRLEQLAALRIC